MKSEIMLFISNGGVTYVMLLLFVIGFIARTYISICYDKVLDSIENNQLKKNRFTKGIIRNYEHERMTEKNIKDTYIFVNRRVLEMKQNGINVDKVSVFSDIVSILILLSGIITTVIIINFDKNISESYFEIGRQIYLYISETLICYLCLKIWWIITNVSKKRALVVNELTDYLNNNFSTTEKNFVNVSIPETNNEHAYKDFYPENTNNGKRLYEKNKDYLEKNKENSNAYKNKNFKRNGLHKEESVKINDTEKVINEVLNEFLS